MSIKLPPPNDDAKHLSDQLVDRIMAQIADQGPISFEQYMSQALYEPGLGYYRNGTQKFGEAGDFVTAPEISPLYSYCIAKQCAQVLSDLSGGDILEFGAGRGVMAADILCYLASKQLLPENYYILELSAQLQEVQRELIKKKAPELLHRVVWLDALPETPITGVVLANEVLDAMPVTLFQANENGFSECGVTRTENKFTLCKLPQPNHRLASALNKIDVSFEVGYTSEINLHVTPWLQGVFESLQAGLVLLIDYGFPQKEFYHADRHQGTLMCHYRHYAHSDPFYYPGLQDITAHVDFTMVAEAADEIGFSVDGYVNQAGFLLNCGITNMLEATQDEAKRFQQNQALLKLTMPSEMGELFKVMGLTKAYDEVLLGFEQINLLERLG